MPDTMLASTLPWGAIPAADALALAAILLLAFALKAATGFGPALVVVSLGSLVVGPRTAVVLAAFIDVLGGLAVAWLDRGRRSSTPWKSLAAVMAAAAVVGGLLLPRVPTAALGRVVGIGVLVFGAWMLGATLLRRSAPEAAAAARGRAWAGDYAVVATGGLAGGLIGVAGPPLILWFGTRLPKAEFRALLVPLFLVTALARAGTYGATGQVTAEIGWLVLLALPTLPLGMLLGDRLFRRWSERGFRLAAAALVVAAGLRLAL
jgi:uncharacterized protein